ncbi:ATP-binding protein [Brucepastera parasyntrophica]|uniref:sensor histidine kinase n=1 Tax=Brucepastera parasyntrophica TaxID=2880008 RepID=UPI00210E3FF5|nr:ATP-binding protein [Brucepastera parasyntrophica]ULQ60410.1 ATP-binding protein [Brucepastera parasyntrophica]
MSNDRNSIAENSENIILALKEYRMWEELISPERTEKSYKNVPELIESNRRISTKIVTFMDTMLVEIEKKQFKTSMQNLTEILYTIKLTWERDYSWVTINILSKYDISFFTSEDIVRVILDNLILNSIQQNDKKEHLDIIISLKENENELLFEYSDDGNGLNKKYLSNPRKILEVHETTRKNGHGLGMWIVNNTVVMSGGTIFSIQGDHGFFIEFSLGGKI